MISASFERLLDMSTNRRLRCQEDRLASRHIRSIALSSTHVWTCWLCKSFINGCAYACPASRKADMSSSGIPCTNAMAVMQRDKKKRIMCSFSILWTCFNEQHLHRDWEIEWFMLWDALKYSLTYACSELSGVLCIRFYKLLI